MEKLLKKFIEKIDFTNVKGMCADMGFQLKFPILTIFASYSFADHYGMVNGRIGTGFRESSSLI